MNKSKFLKRSLAALLAILMVATMIPSAFAAVTTVEDAPMAFAADDPGYNISVDGNRATWDAAENAYTVSTSFEEGNSLPDAFKASMIEVKNHKVTVLSGINAQLKATVANLGLDKAEKDVDSFGVGTYAYDVESVVTNDEGDVQSTAKFKLLVNLTMEPKSSDASLRAIKSARLPYAIKAEFDNEKNTIDVVMALNKKSTHNASLADLAMGVTAKDIFIPTNDAATVEYNNKKVTVTAKNGDTKEYAVTFTEESAFETFKLGDFEGKAVEDHPEKIIVDLPYEYLNDAGDGISDAGVEKLEKMLATWTVQTGNKVYLADDADVKESGKETLEIDADTDVTDTDIIGTTAGKYVARQIDGNTQVKVQTKKSGEKVDVDVFVRVPAKNPDAELTGIQIVDDAYATDPDDQEANYTQYVAIDKGSRNITVNLPTNMKKDANEDTGYALFINVWGAKNSYIELAEGRVSDENAFADDGSNNDGKGLQLDDGKAESANPINVSKPVTLKVISENEATTLLYTLTVKESTSSAATLSSLKVVDDKGEEVGTVKASGKDYTITLPYKYGEDDPDPADLTVIATASSSAKIGYAPGHATIIEGSEAKEAVAAVYTFDASGVTPLTSDGDLTICGIAGAVTNTTSTNTTIAGQLAEWETAVASNADWTISVSGTTVTFTAKNPGEIGSSVESPAPPATEPTGAVETTKGEDHADAVADSDVEWAPFVKDESIGTLVEESSGIVLPLASKDVDASTNPEVENKFMLKVFNGADNGSNVYKVTIKKADPSKEAVIKSAKVTKDEHRANMTEYNTTVRTRDAKDTSVITVSELPYALESVADMRFSELEVSGEAHVVIVPDPATPSPSPSESNEMAVDKDSIDNSKPFSVGAGENRWDKKNKFVEVWVFSEADWYKTDGVDGTIGNATRALATKIYKMSATYAVAEMGSNLISVKSTLDPRVEVDYRSKTVTLTVPYTYVQANKPASITDPNYGLFSLDMDVSKLATVKANSTAGAAITPDKGDADTVGRTMFKVTGTTEAPKLEDSAHDGVAITKFTVVAEAEGKNTSDYNVVVKVAKVETSYEIKSIAAAGKSAVKSEDGETWTLTIPADLEKLQLVDIVTVSKLAAVEVDGAPYDPETYYDLGDDLKIQVTAENEDAFTYTLKIEEDTNQSSDATLSEVKVGEYEVTKVDNAYTVKVPEGTDVTKLPLTLTATDSKIKGITVNGTAYTEGMEVDLTTAATIVVTAEDGSTATYTLTADDGTVAPPKPWENPFTDVKEDAWYYNAVKYANENGLMDGTSADKFSPRVNLTRAQFAQILYNAEGNPDVTWTDKFSDVKEGAWYAKAVIWAAENDVLAGYANGTARPNSIVTREDLVSLLWRYAGKPAPTGTTLDFSDASEVSSYAKDALLWAVENKIISGRANGELDPKGNAQRAEAAQMLMQYFSNK